MKRANPIPEAIIYKDNSGGGIFSDETFIATGLGGERHRLRNYVVIKGHGWIEIGQDEYSKSLVRAIDEGGMVWESKKQQVSVAEALEALEKFLINLFEENY